MILIDNRPTRGRHGFDLFHMATDNLADGGMDELFAMAELLGLRPHWLHRHPGLPHFDIPDAKKAEALRLGAAEVSTRELIRRCKRAG